MSKPKQLVSISEAARRLNRDFKTVHRLINLVTPAATTSLGNLYEFEDVKRAVECFAKRKRVSP
ncbi:MAG: hypothetical protein WAK31_02010 [Chthoniobacterales bacterium]